MTPLEISLLIIAVFFIGFSSYIIYVGKRNGNSYKRTIANQVSKYSDLERKYNRLVGTNAANAKWKNKFEEQRDKAIERIGELDNLVGKYDDENRQLKEQLEGKNKVVKTVRKQGEKKAVKRTVKK